MPIPSGKDKTETALLQTLIGLPVSASTTEQASPQLTNASCMGGQDASGQEAPLVSTEYLSPCFA